MSLDQLDLILYDMYHMDAWLPPLFGKWTEDYKSELLTMGCRRAQGFYRRTDLPSKRRIY